MKTCISNYVELSLRTPISEDSDKQEAVSTPIINLKTLPEFLAQHPYVQNACKWPEKEQAAFDAFLQDIACLIEDRNELRKSMSSNEFSHDLRFRWKCSFIQEFLSEVNSLIIKSFIRNTDEYEFKNTNGKYS